MADVITVSAVPRTGRLSNAEKQRMRDLKAQGATPAAIAKESGRQVATVLHVLGNGTKPEKRPPPVLVGSAGTHAASQEA